MSDSTSSVAGQRWAFRVLAAPSRFVVRWRRSLQMRIVTITLVLSVLVVALLGPVVVAQVRDGLVHSMVGTSLSQVQEGFASARTQLQELDAGTATGTGAGDVEGSTAVDPNTFLTQLATSLCSGAASPDLYQVLVDSAQGAAADGTGSVHAPRACGDELLPSSVPRALRRAVDSDLSIHYTPATLRYGPTLNDPVSTSSGLLFGARLHDNRIGFVDIYYAFPFVKEQQTLELVERWLAAAGVFLVLALGVIAWVVTRQVVTPVRMAAGIAERLAAGGLEERMRVRGEDDLARLASSFNKMATNLQSQIRRLEELSRVQRRFVSDVSHELRTPLTTVRMAADVLHEARESFDASTARSAELLQAQLDRFEELLTDLLEISRFDAGAAVLEAEPVDLCELATRVTETTAPLAERRGSRLRVERPEEPCVAEVDARRIERILRNLVVNAIEHGDGNDVVVRLAVSADAAAVAVRDYGVGLKPGESSRVFNRFWRADPARARTTGGTGLGLAIALEDARLHHGWLQAWGEPGGGSHFRLTVPRVVGTELLRSPLALEPDDSSRQLRRRARSSVVQPRLPEATETAGSASERRDA